MTIQPVVQRTILRIVDRHCWALDHSTNQLKPSSLKVYILHYYYFFLPQTKSKKHHHTTCLPFSLIHIWKRDTVYTITINQDLGRYDDWRNNRFLLVFLFYPTLSLIAQTHGGSYTKKVNWKITTEAYTGYTEGCKDTLAASCLRCALEHPRLSTQPTTTLCFSPSRWPITVGVAGIPKEPRLHL